MHKRLHDRYSRSLIFAVCLNVNESQCLMHFVFVVQKTATAQPCKSGASLPTTPIHQDRQRPPFVCELLPSCANSPVCREPVCHSLSVLSHCPIKKYILWSRSQRVYEIVYCFAFGRQTWEIWQPGPRESPTQLKQHSEQTFFSSISYTSHFPFSQVIFYFRWKTIRCLFQFGRNCE